MTGSTAEALPLQFNELVKRIEEDAELFPSEGKILLTLLIGANDLCMWDCRRPDKQLASFQRHVDDFLGSVYGYFGDGRVDVLIGEIPALEGVPARAKGTIMEPFAVLECPCAYQKQSDGYSFVDRIDRYNGFIKKLKYPSLMITDVLREEALKDWPAKMTSKLDAFHPSKWAQEYFAEKIFEAMGEL